MRLVIKPCTVKVLVPCSEKSYFFSPARWREAVRKVRPVVRRSGSYDDRRLRVQPQDVHRRRTWQNSSRHLRIALYSPAAAIDLQTRAPSPIP